MREFIKARARRLLGRRGETAGPYEEQYAAGRWDFLASDRELARYSVIIGYLRHYGRRRVLDVGCGAGVLAQRLPQADIDRYVGFDFSSVAIEQAKAAELGPKFTFETADANAYAPERVFDAIVMNEVINSFRGRTSDIARRYVAGLVEGGLLIVSIEDAPGKQDIWIELDRALELVDGVGIRHGSGQGWGVRAYRERAS